jgi:hypothetical protein
MKPVRNLSVSLLSGLAALAMLSAAAAAPPGPAKDKNVTVTVISASDIVSRSAVTPLRSEQMSLTSYGPAPRIGAQNNAGQSVPLWTFQINRAPRDGLSHVGAMVGTSPFLGRQTSRIPVIIVPMIITTHTVATSLNSDLTFNTTSGEVTQDSSAPQTTCLSPPNNVPSTLVYQSPMFQNAPFTFGGVFMGDTQYIDAFQRANFYRALGGVPGNYHVLFDPVTIASPIRIDVPANEGLAIPAGSIFPTCGTVQILDINWFDSYLNGTALPELAAHGMNAGMIPVFFLYNTNLASPVTNLNTCCVLGYHSYAGEPTPSQLYSVAEIDVSGLFADPYIENTSVLAHELGELVDDPYGDNEVPPWGHSGQQAACQENLEVGDPLTGTGMPQVTMPNGYTYNLQELVFFSWFIGGKSLAVNGWYSSNGSFTSDAGPPCGS